MPRTDSDAPGSGGAGTKRCARPFSLAVGTSVHTRTIFSFFLHLFFFFGCFARNWGVGPASEFYCLLHDRGRYWKYPHCGLR